MTDLEKCIEALETIANMDGKKPLTMRKIASEALASVSGESEGWISVNDDLPAYDELVVVFGTMKLSQPQMGGNHPKVTVAMRQDLKDSSIPYSKWERYQDRNQFKMMEEVTHWLKLPEPPKPEDFASYQEAYDDRDQLTTYIETVRISGHEVPDETKKLRLENKELKDKLKQYKPREPWD